MKITDIITSSIKTVLQNLKLDVPKVIHLEHPILEQHGDYSTNIALSLAKQVGKNPREFAQDIINELQQEKELQTIVSKIEVAGPGFINFYIKQDYLFSILDSILSDSQHFGSNSALKDKKMMVEFAHPNTHKEIHIGHMRTLITGEALSRLFEASGAEVFRANYQGDIGPHVAKAIFGTQKILEERNITWEQAEQFTHFEKAHLLGEGYIRGNELYEQYKDEVNALNTSIYKDEEEVKPVYERTRKWSLDYFDDFYKRFGTKFNKLYFESQTFKPGQQIVKENIGKVFTESQGAIIYEGEKKNLHNRVFITAQGNPTYEGKDVGLAPMQYADFPFDKCLHVVGNEQKGYFDVVLAALAEIDPKFKDKEYHLPMGMVQLIGKKISSRTGVIITVNGLLEEVKEALRPMLKNEHLSLEEKETVLEMNTLGAVKYSVLKVHPEANVLFDVKQSISLEGNSGPYLQYTHARCFSVINKYKVEHEVPSTINHQLSTNPEELTLLKHLARFPEEVSHAATEYAPSHLCTYLYELAQRFNSFYNKHSILDPKGENRQQIIDFRIGLTKTTMAILKNGLNLLGIQAPEKM